MYIASALLLFPTHPANHEPAFRPLYWRVIRFSLLYLYAVNPTIRKPNSTFNALRSIFMTLVP